MAIEIGQPAPDFELKDPAGDDHQPEAIVTVRAHGYMAGPALTVRVEAVAAT